MKKAITTSPALTHISFNNEFFLESDGSSIALGAALYQKEDNKMKAVAFASRKLSNAERKYPPIEIEALGLVYGLDQFRRYIHGSQVICVTDHKPLCALTTKVYQSGRLSKYQLALLEFNIKIIYRKGRLNVVADALSRFTPDEVKEPLPEKKQEKKSTDPIPIFAITDNIDLKAMQKTTPWIQEIINCIESNIDSPQSRKWNRKYTLKDGLLYLKEKGKWTNPLKVVLPDDNPLLDKLVHQFHDSPHLAGHAGVEKTLQLLAERAHWKNMRETVQQVVQSCTECARAKTNPHTTTVEMMSPMETPETPWFRVNCDLCGPLPVSNNHKYILIIIDSLTKYVIGVPLIDQTADSLVNAFTRNLISLHGCPKIVVTDNGKNFISTKFTSLLKSSNTKHVLSPPYHHSSNGQAERAIRTVEERLRAFVQDKPDQWDKYLPLIIFSINNTKNISTGMTPFFAIFGRNPTVPEDALFQIEGKKREEDMKEIWDKAKDAIEMNNEKSKKKFERTRRVKKREIKKGDLVLVNRAVPSHKLAAQRDGPFRVTETNQRIVSVETPTGVRNYHLDNIRKL